MFSCRLFMACASVLKILSNWKHSFGCKLIFYLQLEVFVQMYKELELYYPHILDDVVKSCLSSVKSPAGSSLAQVRLSLQLLSIFSLWEGPFIFLMGCVGETTLQKKKKFLNHFNPLPLKIITELSVSELSLTERNFKAGHGIILAFQVQKKL